MSRKSAFLMFYLVTAALSPASWASGVSGSGVFYFGVQYKPAVPVIRDFHLKESILGPVGELFRLSPKATASGVFSGADGANRSILDAFKRAENFDAAHVPSYEGSLLGASGVLGYSEASGAKVELEVSFEEFETKHPRRQYSLKNGYKYFAIGRRSTAYDAAKLEGNDASYMVISNHGIASAAALLSVCPALAASSSLKLGPYLCLGAGVEFLDIFGTSNIRFGYQAKMGVSFLLTPRVGLSAGAFYRGTAKRPVRAFPTITFKKEKGKEDDEEKEEKEAIMTTVASPEGNVGLGYAGVEIGMRFFL